MAALEVGRVAIVLVALVAALVVGRVAVVLVALVVALVVGQAVLRMAVAPWRSAGWRWP